MAFKDPSKLSGGELVQPGNWNRTEDRLAPGLVRFVLEEIRDEIDSVEIETLGGYSERVPTRRRRRARMAGYFMRPDPYTQDALIAAAIDAMQGQLQGKWDIYLSSMDWALNTGELPIVRFAFDCSPDKLSDLTPAPARRVVGDIKFDAASMVAAISNAAKSFGDLGSATWRCICGELNSGAWKKCSSCEREQAQSLRERTETLGRMRAKALAIAEAERYSTDKINRMYTGTRWIKQGEEIDSKPEIKPLERAERGQRKIDLDD